MDSRPRIRETHTMAELGDVVVSRRSKEDQPAPTVEEIKRLLVDHHFDSKGARARRLVLQARDVLEAHLKEAWNCGAVVVSGESAIRTGCGCGYCEEWGPIAEIELPVQQPDPAEQPYPERGFVVAVARVPAEDYYRTTAKLKDAYDIAKKGWRRAGRLTGDRDT